jgi:hypothetical protein
VGERVLALHPFHPAEIEAALGDRGPYRSREVRASLGPLEAESATVAAGRTQCRKRDPELGEKPGARCRDVRGFLVEHDVFSGDERIGEINAEAAHKAVVADPSRIERACLLGERTVSRSLLESDGPHGVEPARGMYYGQAGSWSLRDRHTFDTLATLLDFPCSCTSTAVWLCAGAHEPNALEDHLR